MPRPVWAGEGSSRTGPVSSIAQSPQRSLKRRTTPMPMKKSAIEKLLREPNVAVVAVTAPNGAPHAVPTWYEYRAGEVVFHTGPEAFKFKCLSNDPRVTLVVDTRRPPYKCVILKGTVAMTEDTNDE